MDCRRSVEVLSSELIPRLKDILTILATARQQGSVALLVHALPSLSPGSNHLGEVLSNDGFSRYPQFILIETLFR